MTHIDRLNRTHSYEFQSLKFKMADMPAILNNSSVAEMGDPGELCPLLTQCRLGRGLPLYRVASCSIQPFGHKLTIHQRNIQNRQTGQWSDSIGRTVLQTVAQISLNCHNSATVGRIAIMTHFDLLKRGDGQKFDLKTRWRTVDARTSPRSTYSKRLSEGQNRYGADANRVHIGATWRIRLKSPCAAAMRPYVKLL